MPASDAYRTLIGPADLEALIATDAVTLVDCRFVLADPEAGHRAYRQAHLPGAHYAHLDRDLSGPVVSGQTGRHPLPTGRAWARTLGRLGVQPGRQVVAYDDSGGAIAARLWWMLRWASHDPAAVLDGGYGAWTEANGALTQAVPPEGSGEYPVVLRPALIAEADEVLELAGAPDGRVFDARAADRFRGENETIDPVAGHIPGAASLPFADNLDAGRLKPTPEIAERYRAALDGAPAERAVAYCGSGVTACQLLLAAEHVGVAGIRLYPGSWSEWITDPRRPVSR